MAPADYDRIRPLLELVEVRRGAILQDFDTTPEHAFFIESGVASLQARTERDDPVEVGLVGRMGMIGAPVVLRSRDAPVRAVMQVPGESLRIRADALGAAVARSALLLDLLLGYMQALTVQTSQLVLCNARHGMDQRVARWLLTACDRLDDDAVPVTHRILSAGFGVRRPSVTEALSRLEAAGAVQAERGRITVTSRPRLEELSCDCYRVIRAEYARLFQRPGADEPASRRGA
jgi:CRP-like cAMP-binding protein